MRTSFYIAVMLCSTPIFVLAASNDAMQLARAPIVERYCADPTHNCVPLWEKMNAEERAKIWPLLDDVAKETYWRQLSPRERKELRRHLSIADRESFRHRYTLRSPEECHERDVQLPLRKEQRMMIRQQIIEVRQEMRQPLNKKAPNSDDYRMDQ